MSEIGAGMLILGAVEKGDSEDSIRAAGAKLRDLRIFEDEEGRMNRDLRDIGGSILAVSQFTLAASIARGRRPSFTGAEEPGRARELFDRFVEELGADGIEVKTGVFAASMVVTLENDGPVTFIF